jgi:DNA (cytosine-5)-methyltransferase 1
MTDKLRVLDLFSGIGGFSLGLERTGGFETVAFCEIEPFPRRVLAKHWPNVRCYHDVTELTGDILARDGITVDVITGGFPCQDLSTAGKQAGMGAGTRSGLWSEIVRLVGELRPRYVIVENVAALLSGPSEKRGGWFGRVLGDLAECGYDAEWHVIKASHVGAWHERERVWILAYCAEKLGQWCTSKPILRQSSISVELCRGFEKWPGRSALPATRFCRAGNGVPHRLDRLAGLGNAVIPQIPELIGRAILATESRHFAGSASETAAATLSATGGFDDRRADL